MSEKHHHIVTPKTYMTVLGCLMVLMLLTILAAQVHIGPEGQHVWNLIIALLIAGAKMSLIVLFFMHVKYSSKLTRVYALAGFFWLIIFVVLLFNDYLARVLSDSPFTGSPYLY